MIIAFIIMGLMISTTVIEVFTYVMNKDLKKINKRTTPSEQLFLSVAINKIIEDIRYECVGSAFNNADIYLVSEDFGSDAVQFILTINRKKATTFSDWWYYRKIFKKTGNYFSVDNYTFVLELPFKKDYKNFDELKENLMNDLSLQIKQYNITCKVKDLEKDFE